MRIGLDKRGYKMSSNVQACWDLLKFCVFVCVPGGVAIGDLVGTVSRVDGVSMQPALNPYLSKGKKDYVFTNRYSAKNYELKRGEIVTLISPKDHKEIQIKRIIGLPGDYVRAKNNTHKQYCVPKGHCWVEGDHPSKSVDSNSYGPVPIGLIQTKVSYVVWWPSQIRKLEIKEPSDLKVSSQRDPILLAN